MTGGEEAIPTVRIGTQVAANPYRVGSLRCSVRSMAGYGRCPIRRESVRHGRNQEREPLSRLFAMSYLCPVDGAQLVSTAPAGLEKDGRV
jgi:hypothetical protein